MHCITMHDSDRSTTQGCSMQWRQAEVNRARHAPKQQGSGTISQHYMLRLFMRALSITELKQQLVSPPTTHSPYLEARDPVRHRQAQHRQGRPQPWSPTGAAGSTAAAGASPCSRRRAEAGCCSYVVHLQAVTVGPTACIAHLVSPRLTPTVPPARSAAAPAAAMAAAAASAASSSEASDQPPVVKLHAHAGNTAAIATAAAAGPWAAWCCRPAAGGASSRDRAHRLLGAHIPQHHPSRGACSTHSSSSKHMSPPVHMSCLKLLACTPFYHGSQEPYHAGLMCMLHVTRA
jgi:hypothetical protein